MTPPAPTTPDPLQSLLAQCLDRWEDEGSAALDAVCAAHPAHASALRKRVDALSALGLLDAAEQGTMPERIGSYRPQRVLGRGGMGVVFEAEQDEPRRRVALKVLRNGLDTAALRSRFAYEAHLLARLQHPGVAQIYEAGSAKVGADTLPFFAMELVPGAPLDEFVARTQPSGAARLELLAKICDAVQHAHEKGVIHRDLKPSNILVDASGQPKVLDFGVARATDPDLGAIAPTRAGQIVGTLAYMSPEQAAADPAALDTRSDVYALGVIAYEVLTGRLPYAVDGLPLAQALRVIQTQEPDRAGAAQHALRGDLEVIVLTAMAKEKERRYASAAALATDLRRCLRHEPIFARAPTAWYTLRKFARRNRVLVAAAAAVVLALGLGLAGTTWGLIEAQRERTTAEEARAAAEKRWRQAQNAVDFQRRMFGSAQPFTEGKDVRVVDVIDRAVHELDGAYPDQPEVEGSLRAMIAETYHALGLRDQAEPQFVKALELLRASAGEHAPETLLVVAGLSTMLLDEDSARGRALLLPALKASAARSHDASVRAAHAALRRAHGKMQRIEGDLAGAAATLGALHAELAASSDGDPEQLWSVTADLATVQRLLGRTGEAIALLRDLRQRFEARCGASHPLAIKATIDLAIALQAGGVIAESRTLLDQALELAREKLGEGHPDTLAAMSSAGYNALSLREHERAEELFREIIAAGAGRFAAISPLMLAARHNLSIALLERGDLTGAEVVLRELVETLTKERGPEHPNTLSAMNGLATVLHRAQRQDEAVPLYEQVLAIRRRTLGSEHHDTLKTMRNLGMLYGLLQRPAEAEALLREAVETGRATLPADNYLVGEFLGVLGGQLVRAQQWDEAEQTLLESHAWLVRTLGNDAGPTRDVAGKLRDLYRQRERPEDAAQWAQRAGGG